MLASINEEWVRKQTGCTDWVHVNLDHTGKSTLVHLERPPLTASEIWLATHPMCMAPGQLVHTHVPQYLILLMFGPM